MDTIDIGLISGLRAPRLASGLRFSSYLVPQEVFTEFGKDCSRALCNLALTAPSLEEEWL